jgi:hypothetical protein
LGGRDVTVTAYCCTAPIESDRITVPITATVGPGIEFPSGTITNVITSNVDVADDAIDIRYTQSATASGGTFNGYVFDFNLGGLQRIVAVSLDPLSTFAPGSVGLSFDQDSVFYNAAGLTFTPDSRVAIAVSVAPVPEPGVGAMLLAGGLLMLSLRRRRGRTNASY